LVAPPRIEGITGSGVFEGLGDTSKCPDLPFGAVGGSDNCWNTTLDAVDVMVVGQSVTSDSLTIPFTTGYSLGGVCVQFDKPYSGDLTLQKTDGTFLSFLGNLEEVTFAVFENATCKHPVSCETTHDPSNPCGCYQGCSDCVCSDPKS
jgi:hypothetical protein